MNTARLAGARSSDATIRRLAAIAGRLRMARYWIGQLVYAACTRYFALMLAAAGPTGDPTLKSACQRPGELG
jgi:hypothetical protein